MSNPAEIQRLINSMDPRRPDGFLQIGPTNLEITMEGTVPAGAPFAVKDSGERREYDSGMVRDTQDGKPDYTLLPLEFLTRWAEHMTKGAVKYGRENWRLANSQQELDRFKASAMRHMMQWLMGDRDEDHAAAVCFNIAAAEFVLAQLEQQSLRINEAAEAALDALRAKLSGNADGIAVDEPPF